MGTIYATLDQFYTYGLPAESCGKVTVAQINSAIASASAEADSKFRARYPLPFLTYDTVVSQKVCHLASLEVLTMRGFNPQSGPDRIVIERAAIARKWLDDVERQSAHPAVTTIATPGPSNPAPYVISKPLKGW